MKRKKEKRKNEQHKEQKNGSKKERINGWKENERKKERKCNSLPTKANLFPPAQRRKLDQKPIKEAKTTDFSSFWLKKKMYLYI